MPTAREMEEDGTTIGELEEDWVATGELKATATIQERKMIWRKKMGRPTKRCVAPPRRHPGWEVGAPEDKWERPNFLGRLILPAVAFPLGSSALILG
jgi:hypothetical protein